MDRLAKRLRDDAERIEAAVSPELESRIEASLHGIMPLRPKTDNSELRPFRFRWGAALTGAALAAALIVVVNTRTQAPEVSVTEPDLDAIELPAISWRVEPAVLTSPLEQEYADIRSDLQKAEKVVRTELQAVF